MKRSLFLTTILSLFLVLSGCGTDQSIQPDDEVMQEEPSNLQFKSYRFATAKTFDEMSWKCVQYRLNVEEFRLENGDITCGYTVAGRSIGEVRDDFFSQHLNFTSVITRCGSDWKDMGADAAIQQLRDFYVNTKPEQVRISTISIRLPVRSDITAKLGATEADDIIVLPSGRQLSDAERGLDRSSDVRASPQSYWHERWAPCGGYSEVPRDYTWQRFVFNNVQDFAGSNRTYEHETQIYDRNYANFGGYWATNLPNPYKDTGFGDGIDNFTIGTYRADHLRTQVWYWTYMSLTPQSSPTALCKIRGQIGHRFPSWCYSTWCVWADATTFPGHLAYLALPNYGVCWQY